MADGSPGVTVVVPTLNRGAYLLDTVKDLLAQSHRPLEILIVDQSEAVSPELEALVAEHPDLISHHRVAFRGLPIARNYGWQMARHELIVYVDDDIRCGSDLVEGYAFALTTGRAAVVGGGIDGEAEDAVYRTGAFDHWLAISKAGFSSTDILTVDHVRGCSFGVNRSVLRRLRGFDERMNVGAALHEETEFMLRAGVAGQRVLFDGSLRLTHLGAGSGGTRQSNWCRYVHALAHNRSIVIRRHSRPYQWPVALAWSGKLIGAYTVHARDPRIIVAGVRGAIQGWRTGGMSPVCTRFDSEAVR